MKVAGLSHRQMAEVLNERGIAVPSQQSGRLGDSRLRPAAGPRRLWNKTQVQRVLKHLDDVTRRIRWARKWVNKQMMSETDPDKLIALIYRFEGPEAEYRRALWEYRAKNRIAAAKKRQAYREKVFKGAVEVS